MSSAQPTHPTHDRRRHALPQLGRRGAGWVAAQIVLLTAIFLSALVGLGWPSWLEPPAYAIGGVLVATGVGMLVAGGGALARVSAVTPFPAPRTGSGLQTSGIYRIVRHPMYGGGILIALGWSTIFATVTGLDADDRARRLRRPKGTPRGTLARADIRGVRGIPPAHPEDARAVRVVVSLWRVVGTADALSSGDRLRSSVDRSRRQSPPDRVEPHESTESGDPDGSRRPQRTSPVDLT